MQKKSLLIGLGILLSVGGVAIVLFIVSSLFSVYRYDSVKEESYSLPSYEMGTDSFLRDISSVSPSPDVNLVNDAEGSKVQKNGTVSFLVGSINDSIDSVKTVNAKYQGQLTNIYDYGRGNDRVVTLTVKVPVENFEAYYEEIREIEGEVTYANVSTTDVTEEYIDITSRLKNLKSVESQLVDILEDADTVTDILAVQKELNTVRGDIESYEQRKRYFDSQTDYSYISVSFSIDKTGLNIADEQWKPFGEFKAALNSLVSVLKGFVNATIWLLVFSPIVLVPGGIVWYVVRRKKQKVS